MSVFGDGVERILYVMAHPDDEDAATLTYLARHERLDVTLFSLTRGEMGDNAVGSEIAESLGRLRMEEMDAAALIYGVRRVWYGTCFDYGFSKRLEEAYAKWGATRVVEDVVRAIRAAEPDVILGRFSGSPDDGHAHHQVMGQVVLQAVAHAADAARFPELLRVGLPPWCVPAVWVEDRGGEGEAVAIDASVPLASGESALAAGRRGYLEHRSQATHRLLDPADGGVRRYRRVHAAGAAATRGARGPIPSIRADAHVMRRSLRAAVYEAPPGREALRAVPHVRGAMPSASVPVPERLPVDVRRPAPAEVRFVEGPGDCLAPALERLGLRVTKVRSEALTSTAPVADARIVVGVSAYTRVSDVDGFSRALVRHAEAGSHVIVFAQTPPFDPARHAPHGAQMGDSPPEVCEEDAPVLLLDRAHPLVTRPNLLGAGAFDEWVEQRGSKFWTGWDRRYTPLLEMADPGEAPQRGAWLTAEVGAGRYTYCALALHRQLPFGVLGAWQVLANLVA